MPTEVSSNGVGITFDDETFAPQHEISRWRAHVDDVRRRFGDDGYVLLRGALERELVLDVRVRYFERFDRSVAADLPEYGTAGHPAYDFVRSETFDEFSRTTELLDIAQAILDAPAELLPRRILRHYDRSEPLASRAHVDFDYLDHGSDRLVTAWIPLGDCPIECGGLVYLEGSHTIPREALDPLREHTDRPADRRPISNDLALTARTLGGRWLWADYRAGDVLVHSPHIVHASLDNTSDDMRLSADLRFRRSGDARDERWNGAWSADDGF